MAIETLAQKHPLFSQAVQLLQAGRFDDAEKVCHEMAAQFAEDKELIHLRAVIAYQDGRLQNAIDLLSPIAGKYHQDASIINDLGMFTFAAGDLAGAQDLFEQALKLQPDFAGAHLNLGSLLNEMGHYRQAERHLTAAYQYNPKSLISLITLINVQILENRGEQARQNAVQFVNAYPRFPQAHMCLGKALAHLNETDQAEKSFDKAISLAPRDVEIYTAYCLFLAETGRLEEARAGWRRVLTLKPDSTIALSQLVWISKIKEDDPLVAVLQKFGKQDGWRDLDLATINYSLGKVAEDNSNYSDALKYYTKAASLRRKTVDYNGDATKTYFAEIKNTMALSAVKNLIGRTAVDDVTPIFVIGLPRSGTSLTEQILTSHSKVGGAGEIMEVQNQILALQSACGASSLSALVERATPEQFSDAAQRYLEVLKSYSPDSEYVIDKMPSNFERLGIIRLMFPNAKIVHCRRNLLDTALSVFKTNFSATRQGFSYDIEELGQYCALYTDLMAFWEKLWPSAIYHQDYDALISDQEGQTRALLAACGLDWDPACLNFFETRGAVRTASIGQVRQPIYNKSSGISDRYGSALNPLRRALGLPDYEEAEE